MGLSIISIALCDHPEEYSSIKLAVDAGESCISKSGMNRADIDLLINIGVYRDKNTLEPAMSSLIQKELHLNNDPIKTFATHTTFSFDMANGLPSFINAMEVIDSMIQTGESIYAIVVSSDTHPSQKKHPEFPFRNFGAAMLFSRNGKNGLSQYFYKNSGNGYTGLKGRTKVQCDGQRALSIQFEDGYTEKLLAFTIDSIKEAIVEKKIDLTNVKAIIASQPCEGFGKAIAKGIGLRGDLAIDTFGQYGDTYSSALILGYHVGIEKDLIKGKDRVLFIAAGSGLSMGCCVV